jgi:hypothetical protein
MESAVSFKIVLGEHFNVMIGGIDSEKCGFIQDCFGRKL